MKAPVDSASERCPVCETPAPAAFYDGGEVPVFVNVLHDSREAARAAPQGRIELACCTACGHVWNRAFEPERLAYAPGYENSLHGSPTFVAWAESRARALVQHHRLSGARAVDVGGGRGEFAALLVAAGAGRALVVDPSAPTEGPSPSSSAVHVERRLFAPSDVDPETRLLLTRHVVEHIDRPTTFVTALAAAARHQGAGLYIEVPNALFTLRDLGLWDLIYEHCGYYTPSSLRTLCQRAGLSEVSLTEDFHGQFLAAEAPPRAEPNSAGDLPDAAEVSRMAQRFGVAANDLILRWGEWLERQRGRRVALWGVGAKGATFLGRVPGGESIVCGADVNPRKHGRFVAGTGHPIVAPTELRALGVEVLIVLNPAYVGEVSRSVRDLGLAGVEIFSTPDQP